MKHYQIRFGKTVHAYPTKKHMEKAAVNLKAEKVPSFSFEVCDTKTDRITETYFALVNGKYIKTEM